ncbi:hypothetical protein SAMN05443549_103245 [Flavobacterium fluvii]|uniref:Lysozyme inhibitor of I-type lysozyme n=1 Tax=Flavobacterium fluvii TaxID=468056 RepID=A0A1M5IUQ9_9FLAO|nr:PliI family lysozyme inhibitor of I-type lysozyme [Flavobacterium fluvii]SHG32006.1 hypothetical protein SAMN05443549_103245 [Flavobacterium fluvii]
MAHPKICVLAIALIFTMAACKNSSSKTHTNNVEKAKDSVAIPSENKLVKPKFYRKLSLNTISFEINHTDKQLTIQPSGLSIDNSKIVKQIEGTIANAEIGDLNKDGFPEVLVYVRSDGSGSYGTVIGYSVNNGKSMSEINMPNVWDNPKANKGYMGHDEFAIVEGYLRQRFPTYNPQDTNSNPTGKTRQIQYKLKDGENSRVFVMDKITEY